MDIFRSGVLPTLAVVLAGVLSATPVRGSEPQFSTEQLEFFENKVRPLLAEHCQKCHNAKDHKGNLVLDSRENLLKGGDTGPAVIPGDVAGSELTKAVQYDPNGYQMPPDGKLDPAAISTLEEWVRSGVPWPTGAAAAAASSSMDFAARASHWSFQPLQRVSPPAVKDVHWPQTPADRFLLARLEQAGLHPAGAADRAVWIRRAYLDVVGLPPQPGEVAAFAVDESPDAYATVVERLLSSPHFGERWGRHWLDVVRYAESRGHEFDYDVANPWHYRDYVIRAINDDVPYDRFVVEHVAGDLLPAQSQPEHAVRFPARFSPASGANESVVATGFWFFGEWVHSPVDIRQEEAERFANMLDVYGKTFLGLTVACARCHDHKFDPITQRDYYALQGYLQSSVYRQALYESMDHNRRVAEELDAVRVAATTTLRPLLDEWLAQPPGNDLVHDAAPAPALPPDAEVIVDYARPDVVPLAEGGMFGTRVVQPGDVLLTSDPQRPIRDVAAAAFVERDPLWNNVGTAAGELDDPGRLAGWSRAGHTLRTPTFEIQRKHLCLLVSGGCNLYLVVDSHVTINGPLHGALLSQHAAPAETGWRWIEHDVSRYVGHRAHLEIVVRGEEPLRVRQVVQSDTVPPAPPAVSSNVTRLAAALAAPESASPESRGTLEHLAAAAAPFVNRLNALLAEVRHTSPAALAIADGTPEDEYVFIRGNWKKPGDTIPRRYLQVFQPVSASPASPPSAIDRPPGSSGRLELALQMIDPRQSPIVPRVIVNRLWQHYFGRGLVPTSDDFGHMGQPPSHPELLDWLATELVRHDWSLKHIHQLILLSAAYRMDSSASGGDQSADAADPLNILLHRMPLKRLEGEIVRDELLALSGRLDDRLYGRSVPLHLTSFLEGRGRPQESGPLDGAGRRSVYLAVRRNFPEPLLQAFDFPNPHTAIGRRSVSNVPAQALALMNNPFVIQQARAWAEHELHDASRASRRERIERLYQSAFSRPPSEPELEQGEAFLAQQTQEYRFGPDDPRVWADYCHVLVNVKEFVFVR
ncbi:MAG: PSD1 and planctomycete cytochrome C domain-containing protein [Planctomycetaceae bacterium]